MLVCSFGLLMFDGFGVGYCSHFGLIVGWFDLICVLLLVFVGCY